MNCKNAQSLLSAYLDEELTGREMLDIREHLNECTACSEDLQSVEVVKRLLGGAPVPEPSADFEERLVSRVLSATAAPRSGKRISIFALTGIAAASMLGTLLLLNSMHGEARIVDEQQHDTMAYDLLQRNKAIDASDSPLTGSPVMLSRR